MSCSSGILKAATAEATIITARLGLVLDSAGALALRTIGLSSDELAGLKRALDIEVIPDLVQSAAFATERDLCAVVLLQDTLDLVEAVGLVGGRGDAGVSKPLVGRQSLEKLDGTSKEISGLLGFLVVGVAVRFEGGDASAVLAPFMLPECLVLALVVLPVLLHVVKSVSGSVGGEKIADVLVGSGSIALSRV